MGVLVAYGSKRGGTADLAGMIGHELTGFGFEVDVRPARTVAHLDGYDAIVICGALHSARWDHDVRRFARRHPRALRRRPVWLVSAAVLGDGSSKAELPPAREIESIEKMVLAIGARDRVTFARQSDSTRAGGRLDAAELHRWAAGVAAELGPIDKAA